MTTQHGITIVSGLEDWQIIQRDRNGTGRIELKGLWRNRRDSASEETFSVYISIVHAQSGEALSPAYRNMKFPVNADGTWSASLSIPAGGLYRLETALWEWGPRGIEWAQRGDVRQHWGVGDVWLIAGQSNSAGYGKDPVEDPPELGVHLLGNDLHWDLAAHPLNDSTNSQHPANTEGGNAGHSPWLSFAKALKTELGVPIGLVSLALGGSGLSQWDPHTDEHPLHDVLVSVLENQLNKQCAGVLWYQGETDAKPDLAPSYQDRFQRTVAAWRSLADNTKLPVITVQLNRVRLGEGDDLAWTQLREAQRQSARHDEQMAVVPSIDLPLCDQVHISSAGNLTLGRRCAQAALHLAYGRTTYWPAPEATSVTRLESHKLRIDFAHVAEAFQNGLSSENIAQLIHIEDSDGAVYSIAEARLGTTTIEVTTDDVVPTGSTVSVLYGADPASHVPIAVPSYLPLLAVSGLSITE